jgi:hypothetical protein
MSILYLTPPYVSSILDNQATFSTIIGWADEDQGVTVNFCCMALLDGTPAPNSSQIISGLDGNNNPVPSSQFILDTFVLDSSFNKNEEITLVPLYPSTHYNWYFYTDVIDGSNVNSGDFTTTGTVLYINAGSTIENGLTPETGFHNLDHLLTAGLIIDNSTIYFVDNGNIEDGSSIFTGRGIDNLSLVFKNYSGHPTWIVPANGSDPILNFTLTSVFYEYIIFQGLNIQSNDFNTGSVIKIINNDHTNMNIRSGFKQCLLNEVGIWVVAPNHFDVVNNIFTGETLPSIGDYQEASAQFDINTNSETTDLIFNNNTAYYPSANDAFLVISGDGSSTLVRFRFLNNIVFMDPNNGAPCIDDTADSGIVIDPSPDILIDGNFTINCGSPLFPDDMATFIGVNNKNRIDPQLTNPTTGDYSLSPSSPCIDVGIDNSTDPSVPLIDIVGATRPQFTHTDVGAYESIIERVPNFISGTPTRDQLGQTNVSYSVEVDFAGYVDFEILPAGAPVPTADQVALGVDGDGNPAIDHNSYLFQANTPTDILSSILTPGTNYDIYFITINNNNTSKSSPVQLNFTTSISITYYCNSNAFIGGHAGTVDDPWDMADFLSFSNPANPGDTILLDVTADIPDNIIYYLFNVKIFNTAVIIDKWNSDPWRIRIYGSDGVNNIQPSAIFKNGILNVHDNNGFIVAFQSGSQTLDNMILMNLDSIPVGRFSIALNTLQIKGCTIIDNGSSGIGVEANNSLLMDSVFSVAALSNNDPPTILNRCALTCINSVTNLTIIDCQFNWTPPIWPSWDAPKEDWADALLSVGIHTPPEPGNAPYVGYATDPWGNPRTAIGAAFMANPFTHSLSSFPPNPAKSYLLEPANVAIEIPSGEVKILSSTGSSIILSGEI